MKILFLVLSILALGFHCLFEIGNVYVLQEQMKSESSSLEEDHEEWVQIDSIYVSIHPGTLKDTLEILFEETDCVKVTLQGNMRAYEYCSPLDETMDYNVVPGYYCVIGEHEDGSIEDVSDYLYRIEEDFK